MSLQSCVPLLLRSQAGFLTLIADMTAVGTLANATLTLAFSGNTTGGVPPVMPLPVNAYCIVACDLGMYSPPGTGTCVNCSAGLFGNATYLPFASCTGPCAAGRYGETSGLTTDQCTASCPVGAYCPAGAVRPTLCPPGASA